MPTFSSNFESLATQPTILTDQCYPSSGWRKCITLNETDEEVEEVRFGQLDPVISSDYVRNAYHTFQEEMKRDSELFDAKEFLEEVTLAPNSALLVDCTHRWYAGEKKEQRMELLSVENCLLTNDNWKSTAKMLKSQAC